MAARLAGPIRIMRGMGGEVTVTLLRPRGCPRWLWWMSSSEPVVTVGYQATKGSWGTSMAVSVPPDGGTVEIDHLLHGGFGWNQRVIAQVQPGDSLQYRASWFPRPRRHLRPTR